MFGLQLDIQVHCFHSIPIGLMLIFSEVRVTGGSSRSVWGGGWHRGAPRFFQGMGPGFTGGPPLAQGASDFEGLH